MYNYNLVTDNNTLIHYGVLGMKWGVRHDREKAIRKATKKLMRLNEKNPKRAARWARQMNRILAPNTKTGISNKTTTANLYKKYGVKVTIDTPKASEKPSVHTMSDQELQSRINRIRLEQQYNSLTAPKENRSRRMVNDALHNIGEQSLRAVGTVGAGAAKYLAYKLIEERFGRQTRSKIEQYAGGGGNKKQNK